MKKIKAILFDMDGVLIDAKEWHYKALNKALDLFGMKISRYNHLVTFDGLPTRKKLEMLSLEDGLPCRLHEFINALKQRYTMELIYTKCKPIFYHEYALSKLKQDGYHIAVCSNSIRQTVKVMIEKAALAKYVDFYLSNEDVAEPKPHPEIYQAAMAHFNLMPTECLIIEDNENGIKAAEASGGHLMKVETVEEVNYQRIKSFIQRCEQNL
jgi:HAD superfamily hydrolase (TIGR01509 family)